MVRGAHIELTEIVEANQKGSACKKIGLMHFTIPAQGITGRLRDIKLSSTLLLHTRMFSTTHYQVTFSIESLDNSITLVQCAPRNDPVALKAADKHEGWPPSHCHRAHRLD